MPISDRLRQNMTSGMSANGIPNDSTTWLRISAFEGLTPIAMMMRAGIIVIVRRSQSGIWRWMKPCITTCPAIVPTLDDESPEASRAMPNIAAALEPTY